MRGFFTRAPLCLTDIGQPPAWSDGLGDSYFCGDVDVRRSERFAARLFQVCSRKRFSISAPIFGVVRKIDPHIEFNSVARLPRLVLNWLLALDQSGWYRSKFSTEASDYSGDRFPDPARNVKCDPRIRSMQRQSPLAILVLLASFKRSHACPLDLMATWSLARRSKTISTTVLIKRHVVLLDILQPADSLLSSTGKVAGSAHFVNVRAGMVWSRDCGALGRDIPELLWIAGLFRFRMQWNSCSCSSATLNAECFVLEESLIRWEAVVYSCVCLTELQPNDVQAKVLCLQVNFLQMINGVFSTFPKNSKLTSFIQLGFSNGKKRESVNVRRRNSCVCSWRNADVFHAVWSLVHALAKESGPVIAACQRQAVLSYPVENSPTVPLELHVPGMVSWPEVNWRPSRR